MSWGQLWGMGPWGGCVAGPDTTPPTVTLVSPLDGALGVDPLDPIKIRILDDSGVEPASVVITLTVGVVTYICFANGGIKPDFKGPDAFQSAILVGTDSGLDIILSPTAPMPVGTVTLRVQAVDTFCNEVDQSFSFSNSCVAEECLPIDTLPNLNVAPWGGEPWGGGPWGGGFGPDALLPVPGGGSPDVAADQPLLSGSTLGGDSFTLIGTNLACFFFNDIFRDGAIDNTLWFPLGMVGATTEGPAGPTGRLHLRAPALAGQYAGVYAKTLKHKSDLHVEVRAEILTQYLITKPSNGVVLIALEARLDEGNRLLMQIEMAGPTALSAVLRCQVWKFGVLMHEHKENRNLADLRLGIARYYDSVFQDNRAAFFLNGTLVYESFDAPSCTLTSRVFSYTGAAAYAIAVDLRSFTSHSVVVFTGPNGADIARNPVEVTTGRIRGTTPPTRGNWAGPVTLWITNGSGNGCVFEAEDQFTYVFPEAFVVGRAQPFRPTTREASVTNDPALRNPNLNIGTGIRRKNPLWQRPIQVFATPSCLPLSPKGIPGIRMGPSSPTGVAPTPCSSSRRPRTRSTACSRTRSSSSRSKQTGRGTSSLTCR